MYHFLTITLPVSYQRKLHIAESQFVGTAVRALGYCVKEPEADPNFISLHSNPPCGDMHCLRVIAGVADKL